MRKNILLFILVLAISLITAPYFGSWYDKFSPQYSYGLFGIGRENAIILAGIPFAYVFLIPFIFELFGSGKIKKWIILLLSPVLLFYLYDSVRLSYIPISTALISFLLAKVINILLAKFGFAKNNNS